MNRRSCCPVFRVPAGPRPRTVMWILLLAPMLLACAALGPASVACADEETPSAVGPLLKLYQSGRLPAERTATVVEMICDRGNEHDLRVVYDDVLDDERFDAELRRQALEWLASAAATRKVRPAGDLSGVKRLIEPPAAGGIDAQLQQAAIQAAAAWGDASIAPVLSRLAMAKDTSPKLQKTLIASLVAIGTPECRETLQQLANSAGEPTTRLLAAAGLARFGPEAAAATAARVLADVGPRDDVAPLMDAFLQVKGGPDHLAAAIAAHPLPADVAKRALRYMYSVGRSDAALSDELSRAAGIESDPTPPTPEETARIVADVTRLGDPARGERVFRRADLNCMKCHSINRAGGQVGPDLSAVGGSSPVEYIVNSIMNPNLAIKEQFATRVFILTTGQVLTGVVIDRDEVRVNMRDANGQLIPIPVADIDEELEGPSLMPQGLTKFLTHAELLDLARFVSELGRPGPYGIQQAKTIQRWRVLREPPPELVDEVPHLEHIRQLVIDADATAWDAAYGMVSGDLPLAELRREAEPTVLVLRGEVDVTQAGEVQCLVTSDAKHQVWIGSESIGPANSESMRLEEGRHQVIVRVEVGADEDAHLHVEFRPTADSTIQLEPVGGA